MSAPDYFHSLVEQQTFVIAEAGVNHNGELQLALGLIDAAAKTGADAVKFQLFDPETLTTDSSPLAQYQSTTMGDAPPRSQREMLAQLALPLDVYPQLQARAKEKGIVFLCSPFDERSADFLVNELRLPMLKIPSGEITNLPFLQHLSGLNVPIILSTGMSTLDEVKTAVEALHSIHPIALSLLHCVSSYPAPAEAINLKAMHTLQLAFPGCPIGYSDHSQGIHLPIAAVALGARIIEKHFTLDNALPGPDHRASLMPEPFTAMVEALRETEQALGSGEKQPHAVELDCMQVARKSLVAARHLPAGHVIGPEDICIKRPGTGLLPAQRSTILGQPVLRDIPQDTVLMLSDFDLQATDTTSPALSTQR